MYRSGRRGSGAGTDELKQLKSASSGSFPNTYLMQNKELIKEINTNVNGPYDGFIFCDIETTGLDPYGGHILEIGFAKYNPNLELDDVFSTVVLTPDSMRFIASQWDKNDYAYRMHDKSGLLEELDSLGEPYDMCDTDIPVVFDKIKNWLMMHDIMVDGVSPPLCGSSVHFDRAWLAAHMPVILERFSYRNIDVSGLRELLRVTHPELMREIEKSLNPRNEHRVMPDIFDSVDLLKAIRDKAFPLPLGG